MQTWKKRKRGFDDQTDVNKKYRDDKDDKDDSDQDNDGDDYEYEGKAKVISPGTRSRFVSDFPVDVCLLPRAVLAVCTGAVLSDLQMKV